MKKSVLLLMMLHLAIASTGFAAEIIFSGQRDQQFDLFKADLSSGKVTQLTQTDADEIMPCVSADGARVAFVSDRQGAHSLYLAESQTFDQPKYISAGVGAYANPKFSPDGSKIVVRYSPDPEAPFANTQIVILDYQKLQQQVIIDSNRLAIPPNSETVAVVDWPLWVSDNLFVYILAELTDEVSGRMTRSTLYMYDLKSDRHIRMGGGESYFTDSGRSMGFKATMPTIIEETPGAKYVAFVAIKGNVDRQPMQLSLTGSGKGAVALEDSEFFGPLLFAGNTWIYGTMDEDSVTGIAYKADALQSPARKLKFSGAIVYPTLLTP
jgi:dipeptidyl aminopeptidase/acylaminoacyl peptidase